MTDLNALTPNQDERVLAALSHVSALLPMTGVIAPIVIWVTQRQKSQYVAFQALQAMAYQLSMIAAWIVGMGFYMCSAFGTMAFIPFMSSSRTSQAADPIFIAAFIVPLLILGVLFIGGFVFVVYGVIAAIMAFQGKPFRYIIIGSRVERFMQQKPATTENQ